MTLYTTLAIGLGVVAGAAARSELSRLFDVTAWRSNTKGVNWPLVTFLIASLLMVVVQPEARIFLMFLDAVGLDFFLLLLTLQGREYVGIFRDYLLTPAWRKIARSGPVPYELLVFPTFRVMKEYPLLSASSVAAIAISLIFMIVLTPVLLAY